MAARTMWKGSLSFGLVMIPVTITSAAEEKTVRFKQVHAADAGAIRQRRFCASCDAEVPYEEIASGFLRDDGQMIVLTDDDLEGMPSASGKTIDVLHFCPAAQIDPGLNDKPYYLNPQPGGERPYGLVLEALAKSGKVGIAKVALRSGREHLAAIRAQDGILAMSTLRWPDEIRQPEQLDLPSSRRQELTMATSLIASMTSDFQPGEHVDGYRQAVIAAVESKSGGVPLAARPEAPRPAETSLLDALKASLDAHAAPAPRKRAPRKTA